MSVLSAGGNTELRHVEKDVLIPKKMREKAMLLCADYVKGQSPSERNTSLQTNSYLLFLLPLFVYPPSLSSFLHFSSFSPPAFSPPPPLLSYAEFEECIRGRTVSMVWACQESNKRMKECLTQQ